MFKKRSHSVSGPSPSGAVVMEGTLEKKKTFGMNRFHCMLRDGKLWYSEDKGRENVIDISHAQSVREGKAKFSFEIITSSRTHVFIASSQASRDKWMSCLHEVMRASSRKMSIQALTEADEDSVSTNTRSSLAANSPVDPSLKPGAISTLPPALISRTPAKSFEKEGFFDAANLLVRISDADFKSQHGGNVAEKSEKEETTAVTETSETTVKQEDDAKNSVETNSAEDLNLENKVGSRSLKGDDGSKLQPQDVTNYKSILRSENNFQAKELTVASDGKEENDDLGKKYPQSNEDTQDGVHTSSSLYANNADIKRFLSEQKNGVSWNSTESAKSDSSRPNSSETVVPSDTLLLSNPSPDNIIVHATSSLYANNADIRLFLCEQKDQVEPNSPSEISRPVIISERSESLRFGSNIETAPSISEFPEAEDANEVFDQVFPLDGDNRKVIESSKPPMVVQRRSRSGSIDSIQVDNVVPEPVEVELEADFVPTPIPDLPHPRLDSKRSSAFVDILSFLSDKMKNDSVSAKQQQPGCAVECLKHFLHTLDDI